MKIYGIVTHDPVGKEIVVRQMFLTRDVAESECGAQQPNENLKGFIAIREYEMADEVADYFEAGFYPGYSGRA